jgi:hypothetical protein
MDLSKEIISLTECGPLYESEPKVQLSAFTSDSGGDLGYWSGLIVDKHVIFSGIRI